jgi:hypothetical protein
MKKIVRLTESDLVRIVKRVINEERRGGGNTIFILDDKDIVGYGFYDEVAKLMGGYGKVNKKELSGKWKMRLINEEVVLDYYVNGREVFSGVLGGKYPSDVLSEFGNTITGNFKITSTMYDHPEGGPTPRYELHIMK